MPEIIDQANELAERRLEMTIQNMRINHAAVSATHCRDCGEEIPERRRELVAGCQRCADCQEEEELRGNREEIWRLIDRLQHSRPPICSSCRLG